MPPKFRTMMPLVNDMVRLPDRVRFAQLPTPIEKLDRLTRRLGGPEIYVKRDDQTGLATGGNKARKLEFLLADALNRQCDHVVTLGGAQSNHVRQTAAGAARLGLGCSLVLRGEPPAQRLGNLLLDELLGAQLHFSKARPVDEVATEVMTELKRCRANPYLIPLGGSNGLGALGYAVAMEEALDQLAGQSLEIDAMVFASSSAGTQAGLALGAAIYGYSGHVLGISVDSTTIELTVRATEFALEAAKLAHADVTAGNLHVAVNDDYLGGGYAIVGDLERDAIQTVARSEGLLLDPVYTGRAMGGLIDLVQRGEFTSKQKILFWHTGGTAALSAFAEKLQGRKITSL